MEEAMRREAEMQRHFAELSRRIAAAEDCDNHVFARMHTSCMILNPLHENLVYFQGSYALVNVEVVATVSLYYLYPQMHDQNDIGVFECRPVTVGPGGWKSDSTPSGAPGG